MPQLMLSILVQIDIETVTDVETEVDGQEDTASGSDKAEESKFESFIYQKQLLGTLTSFEVPGLQEWIASKTAEADAATVKKYYDERDDVDSVTTTYSHSLVIIP